MSQRETHNPLLEGDQLLLLLLPALKVSIDQALQLHQVLVLTFLLDVLQVREENHRQTGRKNRDPTRWHFPARPDIRAITDVARF